MKTLLVLTLALTATSAQAGFFTCVTNSGTILTAGVDGEANFTNPRVISAEGLDPEAALDVREISLNKNFYLRAVHRLPEESVVYTVETKIKNGVLEAVIQTQAGESIVKEKGICVLKFKPAI